MTTMQEYLSSSNQSAEENKVKNIFAEHNDIFRQYANMNIPKEVLKKMIKDLQDYHAQIVAYSDPSSVQTSA